MRHIITGLIVLALAAAAAWALWPQPLSVETEVIGKRTITIIAAEQGRSRIREVFTVSAPIAGQLQRLNFHAGDTVAAGDRIAAIMPVQPALLDARARRIAEATLEAARAAVDLAAAELKQAEAQLAFFRAELERAEILARRGTISERAREKAELDVATATAAVESARAALSVRERERESAEAALLQGGQEAEACCTDVVAPVAGQVLRVLTESEQVVQAGTPLIDLGNPGDMEIVAEFLSRDAVRIAVGAEARITGWGGEALTARVSRIDPRAVTKVSALGIEEQRVPVTLKLESPAEQWRGLGHDFRVIAEIEVWSGADLIAVPIGALFRDGADWAVYVAVNGKARLQQVKLNQRNDDYAAVTEGLSAGDTVILHPSDTLTDGASVVAAN